ncbi:hypothetical protein EIP86_007762 [Pleurotus ostreatoroseus]|nr:hypothetical protein EIP86_007762 [Pleurotus ostreatoroseus]
MDSYIGLDNFWDISHNPNSFSTLGDEDFLALLQKQFPTNPPNPFDVPPPDGIDPLNLSTLPISNPTPPSTDSSPSPPSVNQEPAMSRRQSGVFANDTPAASEGPTADDPTLKRKASDEDMTDEPTHKNVHTGALRFFSILRSFAQSRSLDAIAGRKPSSGPHRRKSTGNPQQDESRLMKRKEQNRAAQRAFRERKEKHVKDLEDKVAQLEAKNQQAESENDNLRDLLSRLQSENMALKQAAFTFSVPKPNNAGPSPFTSPQTNFFSTPGASTSAAGSSVGSPAHIPQQQQQPQPFDFNFGSLIPFDPASLNMLDEPTATDGAMNMDIGFGQPNGMSPYKTIASNPMYMSFAEPTPYDLTPPPQHPIMQMHSPAASSTESATSPIEAALRMTPFDWNSNSPPNTTATDAGGMNSLDHLFGVGFNGAQSPVDFSALLRSPPSSVSPVSHASLRSNASSASSPASSGPVNTPSPLSNPPANGFANTPVVNGNVNGMVNGNGVVNGNGHPPGHGTDKCPRTKQEVCKMIQDQGPSVFVQDSPAALRPQSGAFGGFNTSPNPGAPATSVNGDSPNLAGDACGRMTQEALMANLRQTGQQPQPMQQDETTVGPNGGFVRKMSDGNGSVVMCKGSSFPKTEKNERNIEVLAAWRSITSNPQFKETSDTVCAPCVFFFLEQNVDINELCSEFTKKARCDGTKVVLEPEGVNDIIESLQAKRGPQ